MKTLVSTFALLGAFSLGLLLTDKHSAASVKTVQDSKLEKQLGSYLVSSSNLAEAGQKGEALIHFQVNANNRITSLQVNSGNPELDAKLQKELAGKKLVGVNPSYRSTYVAQVRFQTANS
jgi:hypothetical protein